MQNLDPQQTARLRSTLLSSAQQFNPDWANSDGRIVVPAPEINNIEGDPEAEAILHAFASAGYREIYCMTTEEIGPDDPNQAVLATLDEVADWRWSTAPFDAVLVSTDVRAAVLFSVDEFLLVAGNPTFVESALNKPIAAALEEFTAYAEEMAEASRHLPRIARAYNQ
ncbi:hypothetical protein AB0M22_45490 [Nocardia sp. NPDC051756]|uniref:hypothetical protein n=1 Tax=Nocardia sp. NPDC051756 TaxID=3154751 RepID=UPI0034452186